MCAIETLVGQTISMNLQTIVEGIDTALVSVANFLEDNDTFLSEISGAISDVAIINSDNSSINGVDFAPGAILSISNPIGGGTAAGTASYTDVTGTSSGSGTGARFTVEKSNGVYTVIKTAAGSGYVTSETITILGSDLGGANTTNDLTIAVDNVFNAPGAILAATGTGTASAGTDTFSRVTGTSSGSGSDARFTVIKSNGTYDITNISGGFGYTANETITISGSALGGTDKTNDLTVKIGNVLSNISGVLDQGSEILDGISDKISSISGLMSGISGSLSSAMSFANITVNIFGCDLAINCPAGDYYTLQEGSGATEDVQTPRIPVAAAASKQEVDNTGGEDDPFGTPTRETKDVPGVGQQDSRSQEVIRAEREAVRGTLQL